MIKDIRQDYWIDDPIFSNIPVLFWHALYEKDKYDINNIKRSSIFFNLYTLYFSNIYFNPRRTTNSDVLLFLDKYTKCVVLGGFPKIEKNRIPKESPTPQKWKCCRLSLIEPVRGRYWKVQVTVHVPYHRLKQNSTFKHENFEILN
jgi:hypothetical protein